MPTRRTLKGSEAESKIPSRSKKERKPLSPARIALVAVIGVFCALLIACGVFVADRWFLHNDAQDIQGTWYVYGTDIAFPIGESTMVIAEDAVYQYTIDTQAKTVTYAIGNLTGTSHYRFSQDRTELALIEDGKKVFTATLLDDISWGFSSLKEMLAGNHVLPGPVQSNVVLLTKTPLSAQTAEPGGGTEEDVSSQAQGTNDAQDAVEVQDATEAQDAAEAQQNATTEEDAATSSTTSTDETKA